MRAIIRRECRRRGYVPVAIAGVLVVWAMAVATMNRALFVPPYSYGGRVACLGLSFWTSMWARFRATTGAGLVSRVQRAGLHGCTGALCCSLAVLHRPPVRSCIVFVRWRCVVWVAGYRTRSRASPVSVVRVKLRPAVEEPWYRAFMGVRDSLVDEDLVHNVCG